MSQATIGFDGADAAFAAFRTVAAAAGNPSLRDACPPDADLSAAFAAALTLPPTLTPEAAARFFATHFTPEPPADDAFVTGYYEPMVDGALERSDTFTAPVLARPDDLHSFAPGEARPPWVQNLAAARTGAGGTLSPYPTRAAIEAQALGGGFRPVVWLRDWVEVFLIHVQGSARVRLADGRTLRLTYAGRNGHPYTSIGRLLAESGAVAPAAMSLARLKAWLRAAGQAPGEPGRLLMQRNASYIFFAATEALTSEGPIGGAGLPLVPLVSIAVDRTLWSYGLPFWIDATLPWTGAEPVALRRLCIAMDTGSAIVGPARVDLFLGTGEEAGRRAGGLRHRGRLTVLRPVRSEPR